jgi:Tfp pilus assembly protein PilF
MSVFRDFSDAGMTPPGMAGLCGCRRQGWRRYIPAGKRALLLAVLLLGGCGRRSQPLPPPPEPDLRQLESRLNLGLAALVIGQDRRAEEIFGELVRKAAEEPAGWADRALARLRQGQGEPAAQDIRKALSLAPPNARLEMLAALAESRRGDEAAALEHLRRAVKIDPGNLKARYALAQRLARGQRMGQAASGPEAREAREQLNAILERQPRNLPVLLEVARDAVSAGDLPRARELTDRIERAVARWPPEARPYLEQLRRALASGNVRSALTPVVVLKNVLLRTPQYHQGLEAIQTPGSVEGEPITRFLRLPARPATPAPPDEQLAFDATPLTLPNGPAGPPEARWVRASPLTRDGKPAFLFGEAGAVTIAAQAGTGLTPTQRIALPGGAAARGSAAGALLVDTSNDFRMDLALAGPAGFRLWQQGADGRFQDVTAKTGIPARWLASAYHGIWAVDVEADGDLDLIAGLRGQPPLLLRNNADGTFTASQPWPSLRDIRDLIAADLDADGDNDLVLLDAAGQVHVLDNERSGVFNPLPLPAEQRERGREGERERGNDRMQTRPPSHSLTPSLPPSLSTAAITVADMDSDGRFDVVLLGKDGALRRAWRGEDGTWQTAGLPRLQSAPQGKWELVTGDFDNNGGLDLIATGPRSSVLFLSDARGGYLLPHPLAAGHVSAVDLDGDGRLDLVGCDAAGRPVRLMNRGSRGYHWMVARPKAYVKSGPFESGDQRNNSFGIGGEMELLSANLVQKRAIEGPVVHFGLGERTTADVLRVTWGNGFPDITFEPRPDMVVRPEQRLKGSCPWLFADNGRGFRFVTDLLWRSPLGMKVNAVGVAPVLMTLDRVRVRRDQLAAHSGVYELRITAELWETMFFDMVSLECVDHPAGTEMLLDERFSIPAPDQRTRLLRDLRPVPRAVDDRGRDITAIVRERDGHYLGGFPLGRYQGVAKEHRLELSLGDWATGTPVWLVAEGWTHPTDSSLNVAIGQGDHPRPSGLRLEVADGHGGWKQIAADAGFPAGKAKTLLLDLTDRFPTPDHRLRMTTNLEIYWDRLAVAFGSREERTTEGERERGREGVTDISSARPVTPSLPLSLSPSVQILRPITADLRIRGYSEVRRVDDTSPELPEYDQVYRAARWRDLIGYYTRPGDVRELLARVDDRYVIMNAGDEIALRFAAPPPPPPGWVRDFVFVSDGWVKDGDLNTVASKTVLPLPTHARADYAPTPTRLEDDPIYRRHRADWLRYHTRYVDGREFRDLLRRGAD